MNGDSSAIWPPSGAGPLRRGRRRYYCIGALLNQAKAMGIPSFPPRQPPIIHPCPSCGKEIFVQFRGCGLRPRILDADDEGEHECPPKKRTVYKAPPPPKPKAAMQAPVRTETKPQRRAVRASFDG